MDLHSKFEKDDIKCDFYDDDFKKIKDYDFNKIRVLLYLTQNGCVSAINESDFTLKIYFKSNSGDNHSMFVNQHKDNSIIERHENIILHYITKYTDSSNKLVHKRNIIKMKKDEIIVVPLCSLMLFFPNKEIKDKFKYYKNYSYKYNEDDNKKYNLWADDTYVTMFKQLVPKETTNKKDKNNKNKIKILDEHDNVILTNDLSIEKINNRNKNNVWLKNDTKDKQKIESSNLIVENNVVYDDIKIENNMETTEQEISSYLKMKLEKETMVKQEILSIKKMLIQVEEKCEHLNLQLKYCLTKNDELIIKN